MKKSLFSAALACCVAFALAIALAGCAKVVASTGQEGDGGGSGSADSVGKSSDGADFALDALSEGGASSGASSEASSSAASASSGSSKSAADPALAKKLAEDAGKVAESAGMDVGLSVIDLNTGTAAGHDGGDKMVSASMIKLIVAETFLQKVAAGDYDLDDVYVLEGDDVVGGTGDLAGLGAGAEVTYRTLVQKMISISDNTATNALISTVGMDAVNDEAKRLGLKATELNRRMMDTDALSRGVDNYTSPDDLAVLLKMVYEKKLVDKASSKLVLQALRDQEDHEGILAGLPDGVAFAHKTGALSNARNDGGIVEANRPFVLVVLCGGEGYSEQGALDAMAEAARTVYETVEAYE